MYHKKHLKISLKNIDSPRNESNFFSTMSKKGDIAKIDIYFYTRTNFNLRAKRTLNSHWGRPKEAPQAIKVIPGSKVHFRLRSIFSDLVT